MKNRTIDNWFNNCDFLLGVALTLRPLHIARPMADPTTENPVTATHGINRRKVINFNLPHAGIPILKIRQIQTDLRK